MKSVLLILLVSPITLATLEHFAVVEHSPVKKSSPINTINTNVREYRKYIEKLNGKSVDLIVFPEYGLTGFIENIEDYALEIDGPIIEKLSNIAREHFINVVVNIIEKYGNLYYNTNLVFNRTGSIIASYRKINVNKKVESDKLSPGESTVEFNLGGVQFGILTNEDILYDFPSKNFSTAVTHVIVPMNWENEGPFGIATSIQAGFALSRNKTVLAANLNDRSTFKSGSGIYSASNPVSFITDKEKGQVILSDDTNRDKRQTQYSPYSKQLQNFDNFRKNLFKFLNEENYDERQYDISLGGNMETKDGLKCSINFNYQDKGRDPIILWSFLSEHKEVMVNKMPYNVRFCSFMACKENEMETCGSRYLNENVTFFDINMKTNLNPEYAYPITLDYEMQPIKGTTWKVENGEIVMDVKSFPNQMLNIFSILELKPVLTSSATSVSISFICMSILMVLGQMFT